MNKITILILTWKNISLLKECIKSLEKQSFKFFDLVVVANGSYDPTIKFLEKKKINHHRFLKNQGVTRAFNYAAKKIQTKYILFLNDDTILDRNCIKFMYLFMEHNKAASACDSKILYQEKKNTIWSAGGCYSIFGKSFFRHNGKRKQDISNSPKEVFCAIGSCVLYNKNDIKRLGFFNEYFYLSHEDLDLSFKILSQKKKIYNIPKSIVYHKVSATTLKYSPSYIFRSQRNVEIIYLLNLRLILLVLIFPLHIIYLIAGFFFFMKKDLKSYLKAKYSIFQDFKIIIQKRKLYQKKNKINFLSQLNNILNLR